MRKIKMLQAIILIVLVASFLPVNQPVLAAASIPPADLFQLPWERGQAWVALDGFDDGSNRSTSSSHYYLHGGAIDFAPHNNMIPGENTLNFWVTAAAAGTVYEMSSCHLKIVHVDGWITEYQHLAKIQIKVGDVVAQNQRLAVIANGTTQPVCRGSESNTPHLHFSARPNMVGATFSGWLFKYSWLWNTTTFSKTGITLGLYKPILNDYAGQTPAVTQTSTPDAQATGTASAQPTQIIDAGATMTAIARQTSAPDASATQTVLAQTPAPDSGAYVSTALNPMSINVGGKSLISVELHNAPPGGYASAEFTCAYNAALVSLGNVIVTNLFGVDPAVVTNSPQAGALIVAIAGSNQQKASSGVVFTMEATALSNGQTPINCSARVSTGNSTLTPLPAFGADLAILGLVPTATPLPMLTAPPPATDTPVSTPDANWLTYTNIAHNFQFMYPSNAQLLSGNTDIYARINLPFAQQGTNLGEKYLEVSVQENANPCQSLLAAQSVLETSQTVAVNGVPFLKQTGGDAGAGQIYQWIAFSTQQGSVCVSLDFILHSVNPGVYATPPSVYDDALETAVFDQIVATYAWLGMPPNPTATMTPASAPTGMLTGQVFATKPVTVSVFASDNNTLIASVPAAADGSFAVTLSDGTYTVVASASGHLNAQGLVTVTGNLNTILPTMTLLAGDIDNNNAIDQFDAMTIGMSYNTTMPTAADLNNDGVINVLDLQRLASNYRKTGPTVWQ